MKIEEKQLKELLVEEEPEVLDRLDSPFISSRPGTLSSSKGASASNACPLKAAKWSQALNNVKDHVKAGIQSSFALVVY